MKETKININNEEIIVKIYKRSKKNIILKIIGEEIHISIPKKSNYKLAHDILKEKVCWVEDIFFKKIQKNSTISKNELSYLGKKYKIKEEIIINEVYIHGDNIVYPNKKTLLEWVDKEANNLILERYNYLSTKLNLKADKIRIKPLKSAWGICYSNKSITYSKFLIFTPLEVIDYVIIHELCHLMYMNHSREFWGLVEKYCTYYKEARTWLKKYGMDLYNSRLFEK